MTLKCAYFSVKLCATQHRYTVRHCLRASCEPVDVKLRKQIICNSHFEREIKLVRM